MWVPTEIIKRVCESELEFLVSDIVPNLFRGTKFTGAGTRMVELF